ncbi:HDOD domain-containing protein [Dechloromonas sp. TW-R-39-2]|uniref:HDOD domain-containing protein n=1 Tax=Dechloromonas sp. TW-R-39-2 TaxID=2654218 RepID=UPI00193CB97D|nr:HDOD domain-containing protein [Dechloromonas sp. TW-R-39-2]QRM19285.1 HDOD domain-containing protein [Dechloromonas sp. TW-R-39-2]
MNAVSEEKQLQLLLQGVDIPPCPAVLIALDAELKKDAPDQRDIVRLVSKDVALSGQLMRIANSPAFSGGHKLTSILQALNVLGTQQIFNLLVSQLMKAALSDSSGISMDRFWESSAQTANLSAELARRLRCVRPDVAYTFGLFHDCGIPLIMKRFPQCREVLAEANATEELKFTEVEDRALGTNHAVVGYFLARRWHLPDFVAEGILHHHDYSVLANPGRVSDDARGLIAICVLAEHIIRLHNQGDGEHEWAKAASAACQYFQLSLGAVDDLIEDMLEWLA